MAALGVELIGHAVRRLSVSGPTSLTGRGYASMQQRHLEMNTENLQSFLIQQDGPTLVRVLLELATDFPNVNERLQRLQMAAHSDLLAKEFGRKLEAWIRSEEYYSWREVNDFAQELQIWIDQVEREVLSIDPSAAAVLFESFIESDTKWFEMCDDSGGRVGDVVGAACEQWLRAARRCEGPVEVWATRLEGLYFSDEYGARDDLMRRANLLLNEAELRQMISRIEGRSTGVHARALQVPRQKHEAFRISAAVKLLAEAMHGSTE